MKRVLFAPAVLLLVLRIASADYLILAGDHLKYLGRFVSRDDHTIIWTYNAGATVSIPVEKVEKIILGSGQEMAPPTWKPSFPRPAARWRPVGDVCDPSNPT